MRSMTFALRSMTFVLRAMIFLLRIVTVSFRGVTISSGSMDKIVEMKVFSLSGETLTVKRNSFEIHLDLIYVPDDKTGSRKNLRLPACPLKIFAYYFTTCCTSDSDPLLSAPLLPGSAVNIAPASFSSATSADSAAAIILFSTSAAFVFLANVFASTSTV